MDPLDDAPGAQPAGPARPNGHDASWRDAPAADDADGVDSGDGAEGSEGDASLLDLPVLDSALPDVPMPGLVPEAALPSALSSALSSASNDRAANDAATLVQLPPPVAVFGAGYVGLVVAAALARAGGCDVVCCERDPARLQLLRQGAVPFHEPGLGDLLRQAVAAGRLRFTPDPADALAQAEIVFVAVGTPARTDGSADIAAVFQVADGIAHSATRPCTVVIKSTVPVGTTRRVQQAIDTALARRPAAPRVRVVFNPEFLREGSAVQDFLQPDRVVIGGDDAAATAALRGLYLALGVCARHVHTMDSCSAELAKYAANAMLATRVSFMNELALLADGTGADIEQVRRVVGSDARIGGSYLGSGLGWGGSCLPKDTAALAAMARQHDCPMPLLAAVRAINERQRRWPLEVLRERWRGVFEGRRVAIWGLAFKPGTDDVRHSPGMWLARALGTLGTAVVAHDFAVDVVDRIGGTPRLRFVSHSPVAAADDADALVVATAWPAYARAPLAQLRQAMREPLVIDGRGVFEPAQMRRSGFDYLCPGRRRAAAAWSEPQAATQPEEALPVRTRADGHTEALGDGRIAAGAGRRRGPPAERAYASAR